MPSTKLFGLVGTFCRCQQLSKDLAQRMEVGYKNAERLIRTELNAVENKASADAMKDAEFTHYQFMATLDRRTCIRCGEKDGEIFALKDMNQGENAPPLHPRCRCTIVATFDTPTSKGKKSGERFAREVSRERAPADMSYKDWRAVYIDKTKTFEQWQKEMDAKYRADSLTSTAPRGNVGKTFDLQRFGGQKLPEGNYNLTLRRQVQNRHIEGTKEYAEYAKQLSEKNLMPSKMRADADCQALIKNFHGKGIYDPNFKDKSPREKVDTCEFIGQYWDKDENEFVDTTWIKIVYSKHGAHVYPIRPEED